MRFKSMTEKIQSTYTRDGITVPVTKEQTVSVPALPVDWQLVALRAATAIVLALTLITVAWSTWSIGELLEGGVGYAAAAIFDLGWAMALLLEFLARYDRRKRGFPKKLGWALLVVTMVAIAWHGVNRDSWAMAVIGAFVSLFAKCLWMGVMKHINAELSEDDEAWVANQLSAAQAQAAIAQMRRQTERTKQNAALELLAMEKEQMAVAEAFGLGVADAIEPMASAKALAIEPPTLADLGKAGAVRFALSQLPDATHEEIVELLQDENVDIDLAYVRQTISRMKPEPEAEVIELRK